MNYFFQKLTHIFIFFKIETILHWVQEMKLRLHRSPTNANPENQWRCNRLKEWFSTGIKLSLNYSQVFSSRERVNNEKTFHQNRRDYSAKTWKESTPRENRAIAWEEIRDRNKCFNVGAGNGKPSKCTNLLSVRPDGGLRERTVRRFNSKNALWQWHEKGIWVRNKYVIHILM